ncbi:MAG: hypothetical protein GTO63_34800, partial [Anaerolineae bacterium]|nr:hypothetical protein [Anaerolineae bacterium]NIN99863.1 hypothetical protein [Anaerolineae bacterium]NIQ82640.1 hypothetical protein [Anaerolineae bacterium]
MKGLATLLVAVAVLASLVTACVVPTPVVVEKEVVVTATPPPEPPAPAVSEEPVRFLIAENFWADWEPYNYAAQSQRRVARQVFDHLVEADSPNIEELSPG